MSNTVLVNRRFQVLTCLAACVKFNGQVNLFARARPTTLKHKNIMNRLFCNELCFLAPHVKRFQCGASIMKGSLFDESLLHYPYGTIVMQNLDLGLFPQLEEIFLPKPRGAWKQNLCSLLNEIQSEPGLSQVETPTILSKLGILVHCLGLHFQSDNNIEVFHHIIFDRRDELSWEILGPQEGPKWTVFVLNATDPKRLILEKRDLDSLPLHYGINEKVGHTTGCLTTLYQPNRPAIRRWPQSPKKKKITKTEEITTILD